MSQVLTEIAIPKSFAQKIYNQMLNEICGMQEEYSLEKSQEEVVSGSMVGENQFLIKIKTDNSGTAYEHIVLKNKKVSKYKSYQKKGEKLFKFSDDLNTQFTKLEYYIK